MKKLGLLLALVLGLVMAVPVHADTHNHALGDAWRKNSWLRATGISAAETGRPSQDFIDVSSHNGSVTTSEFKLMKDKYGLRGVAVKLTEGTYYRNPYAKEQIANATAAGLKVSAYHYSTYTNSEESVKEAEYFNDYALELNLPKTTTMVNDYEQEEMVAAAEDSTRDSQVFANYLKKTQGYSNVIHYSSANLFTNGTLDQEELGEKNCWVAQWPNDPSSDNQLHTSNAAWQWASDFYYPELGDASVRGFDINSDYTGVFSE